MNGVRRGKGVRTTIPAKDGTRAGDLLDRDFTAPAPNRVWVTDFTYVPHLGRVRLRRLHRRRASPSGSWPGTPTTTKRTDLVMTPLRMALWQRDREGHPVVPGQLIHHTDAGSQYTSIRFTEHLDAGGHRPSIGTVGDAYDNALMESVDRPVQDRVHPHHDLPRRPLPDHRRRRVRHRRLGRLVQQPTPPRHPRHGPARRVRASPLRCPQPRAATRMRAARNPGRFTPRMAGRATGACAAAVGGRGLGLHIRGGSAAESELGLSGLEGVAT